MYSACIQFIEVSHLAQDDRRSYYDLLSQLYQAIKESTTDSENLVMTFLEDKLYIQTGELEKLIHFVQQLRLNSIRKHSSLYFKSAICKGEIKKKQNKLTFKGSTFSYYTYDYEFEIDNYKIPDDPHDVSVGFKLKMELENMTGIGINLLENISEKYPSFSNQMIIESRRKYESFVDLELSSHFHDNVSIENIIDEFVYVKQQSKKNARVFIPLLISWAASMDLNRELDQNQKDLDTLLDWLMVCKDISGIELVFLKILDRAMTDENINNERKEHIIKFFQNNKYFDKYISLDSKKELPREIITPATIRSFAHEKTKFMKQANFSSKIENYISNIEAILQKNENTSVTEIYELVYSEGYRGTKKNLEDAVISIKANNNT